MYERVRRHRFVLAVVLVLSFAVGALYGAAVPSSANDGGVIGDDYPAVYKKAAKDALVDKWLFYNRECVSFVAWRLNSANGIPFYNYYKGVHWGNGSNWYSAAKKAGFTVNKTPSRGAVYWKSTHVAWVCGVNGRNVTIEEYNYDHAGHYRSRTVQKGASGVYYLHIGSKGSSSSSSSSSSSKKVSMSNTRIRGIKKKYKYTGGRIVPKVKVSYNGRSLTKGKAYTVSCSSNLSIGIAKVKITGKSSGGFTGTVTKTFRIVPHGTTIRSLAKKKPASMLVTWNRQPVRTSGYQIQYSRRSSMALSKKKTIRSTQTGSTVLSGLYPGYTYYVRIRTFKDTGSGRIYSKWCRKKTIKI